MLLAAAIVWVLLLPPITVPPGPSPDNPFAIPVPDTRAPIHLWKKAGEFETSGECERERKQWDKLRDVGEEPVCVPVEAWRNTRPPDPILPPHWEERQRR